jgi:hypothetical protein
MRVSHIPAVGTWDSTNFPQASGAPPTARLWFLRLGWDRTNVPCPILAASFYRKGETALPPTSHRSVILSVAVFQAERRICGCFSPASPLHCGCPTSLPLGPGIARTSPRHRVPHPRRVFVLAPWVGSHKCPVPHPCGFFLPQGWDSTNPPQPHECNARPERRAAGNTSEPQGPRGVDFLQKQS